PLRVASTPLAVNAVITGASPSPLVRTTALPPTPRLPARSRITSLSGDSATVVIPGARATPLPRVTATVRESSRVGGAVTAPRGPPSAGVRSGSVSSAPSATVIGSSKNRRRTSPARGVAPAPTNTAAAIAGGVVSPRRPLLPPHAVASARSETSAGRRIGRSIAGAEGRQATYRIAHPEGSRTHAPVARALRARPGDRPCLARCSSAGRGVHRARGGARPRGRGARHDLATAGTRGRSAHAAGG